jgi:four helix bundle protein
MVSKPQGLQVRLVSHASAILNITSKLPKTAQANHVSRQLLRSGTAAAANYGEARGAESRSDFIHKLRIVLKELNETSVWLELIVENAMLPADKMRSVVVENDELCTPEALIGVKARLRSPKVAFSSDKTTAPFFTSALRNRRSPIWNIALQYPYR